MKAKRAQMMIGLREVDVFQMPDSSYRMSQTQTAETVGLSERNARAFWGTNAFKSLVGQDSRAALFEPETIEIETDTAEVRSSRINALPFEFVLIYWVWQAFRGNKVALSLVVALALETLDRKADRAFGVVRTEEEYERRLAEAMHQNERLLRNLEAMGQSMAAEDDLAADREYLYRYITSKGFDPYSVET